MVSYNFDEMEAENLAYVSTQPSILEILSKRGRTSLADNLKYNLEITNDQYAEIKKVWQKQKGFKELIKEMEERSEPFDAEPLPEQEGEGGGEIVEKANKTPAKASPKKKDSKKLKGDPKSKASEDDQEVLLPGAKRLKKTPAEELHAEVVPSDIIEVPATEEPEAVLREEAPAAPAFQVTGNASSAFAGIGTILNKQPEVYSFLVFNETPRNVTLTEALGIELGGKLQPFSATALALQAHNCVAQGDSPIQAITLSTLSLLGLLHKGHKGNVKSVKPTTAADYKVKVTKCLSTLGLTTLADLQKVAMAVLMNLLSTIGKSQIMTTKSFNFTCKQLGVDTSFSADLRSSGQKIDAYVKACSQGQLFGILVGVLNGDPGYTMPERFGNEQIPARSGSALPAMTGLSAELFARLRAPGELGPLSRETAKLQAYLPAVKECIEHSYLPANKSAFNTVLYLVEALEGATSKMLDWAPISGGEVEHNVNPYERMECNKVNVKAALEAFRQPIAVGAHFNCDLLRCHQHRLELLRISRRENQQTHSVQQAERVDHCKLFQEWLVEDAWVLVPFQANKWGDSTWGRSIMTLLWQWLQQCKWPKVQPPEDTFGVTWVEPATSFFLYSGMFLPVKRDVTKDTTCLVPLFTLTDLTTYSVKYSELVRTFVTVFQQLADLTDVQTWPKHARGLVRSTYVLGGRTQPSGIKVRPSFFRQSDVVTLLQRQYLLKTKSQSFDECPPIQPGPPMVDPQQLKMEISGSWNARTLQFRRGAAYIRKWRENPQQGL